MSIPDIFTYPVGSIVVVAALTPRGVQLLEDHAVPTSRYEYEPLWYLDPDESDVIFAEAFAAGLKIVPDLTSPCLDLINVSIQQEINQ